MDEREVRELLDRLLAAMDPAQEFEARHEDFTVEFPQSGERMNRGGLRSMQEVYPGGAPSIRLRRLVGAGDVWIAETAGRYGDGSVWHGVDIIEFRDGKIWKETRYWAEPFEAPEWRAQWVEGTEGT
ncbi:MAG: nuclear transport factor 2 family protein [Actinomycetota bacterium]|nr:nuclear transport factor 2 family protein [Actinomycetota bacterium]